MSQVQNTDKHLRRLSWYIACLCLLAWVIFVLLWRYIAMTNNDLQSSIPANPGQTSQRSATQSRFADGNLPIFQSQNTAITSEDIASNTITYSNLSNGLVNWIKSQDSPALSSISVSLQGDISIDTLALLHALGLDAVDLSTLLDTVSQLNGLPDTVAAEIDDINDILDQITNQTLASSSILTQHLADGAVTTAKIAVGAVTNELLGQGAVDTVNIAQGAVTSSLLATGSVTSDILANGAVTAQQLTDGIITTAKIASGAITTPLLADNSVTGDQLADGVVVASKLAVQSVGTLALTDGAVNGLKLASNAVSSTNILDGAISTADIADGAITGSLIAAGTITNGLLTAGAVDTSAIASGAITSALLAPNSVTATQLAASAITGAKIADGSIDTSDIASGAITNALIAANAIGSNQLADNAVLTSKLSTTANKRTVTTQVGSITIALLNTVEWPAFVAPTNGTITKVTFTNGANVSLGSSLGTVSLIKKSSNTTVASVSSTTTAMTAFTPVVPALVGGTSFNAGDVYTFKWAPGAIGVSVTGFLVTVEYIPSE